MKIIVCGNGDNKMDIETQMKIRGQLKDAYILDDISFVEKTEEQVKNDQLNKKHDELLTVLNKTPVPVCFDSPDPVQEYNNPRNRHERRKLDAKNRCRKRK